MTAASFGHVTVGTSATLICSYTRGEFPFKIYLQNGLPPGNTSADLYVGDASVTTSNGYRVSPGAATFVLDVPPAERGVAASAEALYGITNSGSVTTLYVVGPS